MHNGRFLLTMRSMRTPPLLRCSRLAAAAAVGACLAACSATPTGASANHIPVLALAPPAPVQPAAGATAFASNIVNNLPAALIARSVLLRAHAHTGTVLATLIGSNVGPMITPFGSLATMLVLALARRDGEEVRAGQLVVLGLWAVPVIVVLSALSLSLTFALVR